MKKLMFDMLEVLKDLWLGFVWLVQAADELGEKAGEKAGHLLRKPEKTIKATQKVINNCVAEI